MNIGKNRYFLSVIAPEERPFSLHAVGKRRYRAQRLKPASWVSPGQDDQGQRVRILFANFFAIYLNG
jgi:hypothetical protein